MTELTASYVTLHGGGFTDPARTPFAARAAAAAKAGFTGIGVQLADLARTGGAAVIADRAVAVTEAEFLGGWVFAQDPEVPSPSEELLVDLARVAGPLRVTSGEFAAGPVDPGRAADALAALANRLVPHGITLAVEAFAWGAIRDYPTALELVRRSGAANAGLMIDVWHWFATGSDIAQLRDIDPREIAGVQLNDGPRTSPDDPEILHRARNTRWLPGAGELPVRELVGVLHEAGYTGPYSVEVNYRGFRELPVEEAARAAYDTSIGILNGR
ncbi:sugar phosphate isomerase/epimerase family protein [Nocardia miyunensis]|uniref:sugar phosphate isomerase/epimerase family protein n=1 Tax=Nocardia miyunensis TaxID=282684 RepID=UPI0008343A84|nr:sugar phosphate isomerase/epimerase [Nocardia miyunensis]